MSATPGRFGGIALGLVIVLVGYSMFRTDTGIPQTPATIALSSVLVSLGIGAIGAALMPNTLTIDGKDVTPLGLSGSATGGAAFFVATLVFLYATGANKPGDAPKPEAAPTSAPSLAIASPGAVTPPDQSPGGSPAPLPSGRMSVRPDGDDVDDGPATTRPIAAQPQPDMPGQAAVVRVRTYCSSCCPQGPQGCPNAGFGIAPTFQQAAAIAVQYCIGTGGHPDTCSANVEQY